MNHIVGDELMVVGGPELDDLASLLMLDEFALENSLDEQQWPQSPYPYPSSPLLSSSASTSSTPPGSPLDYPETKSPPASPCSIEEADQQVEGAQRRRRHRESMARYRQERRDRVETMKEQEKALQRIMLQVLAHNKHVSGASSNKTALQQYQARFTELVRAREVLLLEKSELSQQLSLNEQRARAFQSLSEQTFSKSMFVFHRTPGGVWLRYDEDEAPFYYEPIQEELCRKTITLGLKKMAELLHGLPRSNLPIPPVIATSQCMGWNTERAFTSNERNDRVMLFRFSRRVLQSRATLDQLLERSWKIYTSPDAMNKSSASSVRTQLVQQVHEDIVVLIRNAPEKKNIGRSRYLGLYHRIRPNDDADRDPRLGRCAMLFTMLMNRAPKEEDDCAELQHSGSWLKDGCALLRFTEKPTTPSNPDAGVDIEYMGYLECHDVSHGEHMWTELCLLMMLWEHAVAPQQLITG